MPSPTERTRPTSETSASWPKFLICSLRIAEISAAWMVMSPDLSHGVLEARELRADRSVDQSRAELDDEAADERRIDGGFQLHLAAHGAGQRLRQRVALGLGESLRGGHLGGDLSAAAGEHLEEG